MWHRLVTDMFDPDPHSRYLDRFGWLLALTYLTIAGQMLVDLQQLEPTAGEEFGSVLAQFAATAMLLLALRACGVSRRWRQILTVVAVVSFLARVLIAIAPLLGLRDQSMTVPPVGAFILMLLTFWFVSYRLSRHRQVRAATLLGSITAYLLIPIIFCSLFIIVNDVSAQPFFGRPAAGQEFMYFSLTTVTTLGYGDPRPATHIGQLLATTEALVGQLYLVVVVALIVGLMASRWKNRDE